MIRNASNHPIEEVDFIAVRAWECGDSRVFDLGDGWALFVDWPISSNPLEHITWTGGWGHLQELFQDGKPIDVQPFNLDWDQFPPDQPLLTGKGPALFSLGDTDTALTSALLEFRNGSFFFQN